MRKKTDEGAGFAAAYREGLSLAAIAVFCGGEGVRIIAPGNDSVASAAESPQARWWCRSSEDAVRIAAAAARRIRGESNSADAPAAARAVSAVLAAANKCNVALYSDADISEEALKIAARVDAELRGQLASGDLKSVNRAYRNYRLETTGRGERVLRYDEWMRRYREDLVRQIAEALR